MSSKKSRRSRIKRLLKNLTPSQKLRLAAAIKKRRSAMSGMKRRSAMRGMKGGMYPGGSVVAVKVPPGGAERA
jgi:hypothetical protein